MSRHAFLIFENYGPEHCVRVNVVLHFRMVQKKPCGSIISSKVMRKKEELLAAPALTGIHDARASLVACDM